MMEYAQFVLAADFVYKNIAVTEALAVLDGAIAEENDPMRIAEQMQNTAPPEIIAAARDQCSYDPAELAVIQDKWSEILEIVRFAKPIALEFWESGVVPEDTKSMFQPYVDYALARAEALLAL